MAGEDCPAANLLRMKEITFSSDVDVRLMQHMGSDSAIVAAARVSTKGADSADGFDTAEGAGLINFLMSNRHGTPFEHNAMTFFVKAPIFVFREFHRHRIGWCLSGDTEIWCETYSPGSGRTLRKRPIAELWRNWHEGVTDSRGRTRILPSCKDFTVRTLNEETQRFELGQVVDIFKSGRKQLWRLATEDGKSIRASEDHRILSIDGWKRLSELRVGEYIAVNGKRSINEFRQVPPSLRSGIGVWTSMQRNSLILPFDKCYKCGAEFERSDLHLDHIVPVVEDLKLALDVENLAPMCHSCHRIKSGNEQGLASRGLAAGSKYVRISSIEKSDIEETYDISIKGEWNNFVANGIVVHNSYNEESGRYTQLKPEFYIPAEDRNLKQVGKPGHYEFVPGDTEDFIAMSSGHETTAIASYENYERLLNSGIAKEVARMTLPVNIYSTMYATCNARSLMAFLSLRTKREDSKFPSYPMREIEMVAEKMEQDFAHLFPITYESFNKNGRVAP